MLKVLAIDDQPAVLSALEVLFEIHGLAFVGVSDPDAAEDAVRSGEVGVVIQDMNFRPGATEGDEGIRLFRRLRAVDGELPILLITAWTSLETAVQLVKEGASDYLAKPWDDAKLVATVRELLDARQDKLASAGLEPPKSASRPDEPRSAPGGLVYQSREMARVVALAESVARSAVPILLSGPNGSGKERLADLIHAASPRRGGPLVKVNVGALPEELMEAELFGAEAGAYTGRKDLRKGRFEAAAGGTLFLDEIDSLSLAGQVKLLRVLENGEFSRLGSNATLKTDVRVVSASNADLQQAIAEGRLREDLYYRLNVIEVCVPALAERPDDILPLAEHFLAEFDDPPKVLDAESRAALLAYPWPGNVRELRNRMQRANLVSPGPEITPDALDLPAEGQARGPAPTGGQARGPAPTGGQAPSDPVDASERHEVERALEAAGGVVSRAAEELGISRQALYRKMTRLGIVMERRPRA